MNKTFVITGTFDNYSRDQIIEIISNGGGTISNSVSKNTHALILGDKPGSKYKKAKDLNIEIINEKKLAKQWIKEYGTASWYDWNVAHWNTKWNVNPDDVSIERSTTHDNLTTEQLDQLHDTIADQLQVHFSTAWDSPTQIFMKLALDYNVMIKVDVSGEVEKPWSDEYDGVNMVCTLGDQKPRTLSYELIAQFSNDTIEYVNTLHQKLGSNRDPKDYSKGAKI